MDHEAAKKIAERFIGAIEKSEGSDVFADDVFADINVPEWRFQLQGRDAITEWLSGEQPNGSSVASWRADPTASGVLVELVEHIGDSISRNMHRLEVRDTKITEWTMYCTGVWDQQTQERQRREAPMIRE